MPDHPALTDEVVEIPADRVQLDGSLVVPPGAAGIVLFAHGSGSSRLSPRNVFVARVLQENGLATLLFDLLTPLEAEDRNYVFDIGLLAKRLRAAMEWVATKPETNTLPVGLFGASTGAAAALQAAGEEPGRVAAVVSRGGRPDLAMSFLGAVRAPTLLIVGALDFGVIELNEAAYAKLRCPKELVLIPGATHLFEEPGTLEQAADHATRWFGTHLRGAGISSHG